MTYCSFMKRATRYERIIFQPGGTKIAPIGKTGKTTCTNLPDTMQEVVDHIQRNTHLKPGQPFVRGTGDQYILDNPGCELKYYLDGKQVRHIK